MTVFLTLAVSALGVGCLYGLIAVGFAMIFGMTKIFHLAYGAVFLVAGYAYYVVTIQHDMPVPVGVVVALVGAVLSSYLIYALVYARMLRFGRSFFAIFVASFGVLVGVQNAFSLGFGVQGVPFGNVLLKGQNLGGVEVTNGDIASIVAAIVVITAVVMFLRSTVTGRRLRALAESPDLVEAFGLSGHRYQLVAYLFGSVLVVPGAIILAYTQQLAPSDGATIVTIAMVATIAGGIGSLVGSGLAAVIYGLFAGVMVYWLPGSWAESLAFGLFFVVLLVRPDGIMAQQ